MKDTKKLIGILIERIRKLVKNVESQREELSQLDPQNTHSMEVNQENRVQNETDRRSVMNDPELNEDLQKQYGKTKWAKKLIEEILVKRIRARAARKAALQKSDTIQEKQD